MPTEREAFAPTADSLAERLEPLGARVIGESREGRPLLGLEIGEGPVRVSITAGAHADEPTGPLTTVALAKWLLSEEGADVRSKTSWHICPHVNPDGAERNAGWFTDPPDLARYLAGAVREPPGEDVEFNYPNGGPSPRPENNAVAAFLQEGAPYHLHFSLHGMGFAEGAWWLIGEDKTDETAPLRETLAGLFREHCWNLFDWDRKGEKGFRGLGPGFSTTPTSTAMKAFFHEQSDEAMAAKFRPSSMEFVQSLGGDPLVMVSELPLFAIEPDVAPHPSGKTAFERVREHFQRVRHLPPGERDPAALMAGEFTLRPIPFATQIETLLGAVRRSAQWVVERS
jgi:hypothetical protein